MRKFACLLATVLMVMTTISAAADADLEARRAALNDLLHEQWEYTMRSNPLYASFLGDKRYNDQLDDFSQKHIDDDLEQSPSRKF
jgi:hypothetical protein